MTIDQLKQMIRTLGKNGSISISNRQILEREAYRMGISDEDLQRIIDEELTGVKANADDSNNGTDSSSSLKVHLGKPVSNANTWNLTTGEFGRTSDDNAQGAAATSSTSEPTSASASSSTASPTIGFAETHGTSADTNRSSSNGTDVVSSKASSSKWVLIAAALLFIGAVAFFLFGSNVNCNGSAENNDTTATQNQIPPPSDDDTIQRGGRSAGDTTTQRQTADTTAQGQRTDTTTATVPRRTVTDLDRLASKILEEQGDKQRQDNNIEKAKQLYDSAARKDPENINAKRKLDSLNNVQP